MNELKRELFAGGTASIWRAQSRGGSSASIPPVRGLPPCCRGWVTPCIDALAATGGVKPKTSTFIALSWMTLDIRIAGTTWPPPEAISTRCASWCSTKRTNSSTVLAEMRGGKRSLQESRTQRQAGSLSLRASCCCLGNTAWSVCPKPRGGLKFAAALPYIACQPARVSGKRVMGRPVAANKALAMAGPIEAGPSSPAPRGRSPLPSTSRSRGGVCAIVTSG